MPRGAIRCRGSLGCSLPKEAEVAVAMGIIEVGLAAALFVAGQEELAGISLTLGLWMLGRSLRKTE